MSQNIFTNQPPLIVFTICLTIFGCTMIILAHLIGEREVPNPDVQMDWNKFFQKVSDLKLCPLEADSMQAKMGGLTNGALHSKQINSSTSHVVDESKSLSAVISDVVDSAMDESWHESQFTEISVKVIFELHGKLPPTQRFIMKGTVKGKLLGLPGKYAHLLYNASLGFQPLKSNFSCNGNQCRTLYDVCIRMSLPKDILPKTKIPDRCEIKYYSLQDDLPIVFSENSILDFNDTTTCLELSYTPDSKLTEMLSPQDRSIVNLHLMHTSYFMFVMVMTLVCFSLVRGRLRQPKHYQPLQKVPTDA